MRRAPGGSAAGAFSYTVLYDDEGVLDMNGLGVKHTHYVMEQGGRIVHRSRSGDDSSFRPVLDRLLGR